MSTITVNGARVSTCSLTIPMYGAWSADVVMADGASISGAAVVVVGDLTLHGTVTRSASFAGSTSARIVGGGGGWRNELPSRGYSHVAGVLLSTVCTDAATEAGETIVVTPDRTLGGHYAREGGKAASAVLHLLIDSQWWIDPNGVTQMTPRLSTAVVAPFTVTKWSAHHGMFEIATESIVGWQPGRTFSASTVPTSQTISSVSIEAGNDGKLRLIVLTTEGATERLRSDLRAIIRAEMTALSYSGVWEYTIASGDDETVDVDPSDARMPSLTGVPMMPGLMGEVVTPTAGSKCRIAFVNADPTRPECIGIVGTPTKIEIAGPIPTQAAARFGDAVSGVAITAGSLKVFIG